MNFISKFWYQKGIFHKPRVGSEQMKNLNKAQLLNRQMVTKLEQQRKNIDRNTPRVAVVITALFGFPSFYYLYQSLCVKYNDLNFYHYIKKSIDWINLNFAFFGGIIFSLEMLKFSDVRATNQIQKFGTVYLFSIIPIVLSQFSLSQFDSTNKYWPLATMFTMFGQLILYSKAVHEAQVPFWCFNLMYHIYGLNFLVLVIQYCMLRNLQNEIDQKPNKFLY